MFTFLKDAQKKKLKKSSIILQKKKSQRAERYENEYLKGDGIPEEFFIEIHDVLKKWISPKNDLIATMLYRLVCTGTKCAGWYTMHL